MSTDACFYPGNVRVLSSTVSEKIRAGRTSGIVLTTETRDVMENFDEIYERFGRLLEDDRPYADPACTFEGICRSLGADPAAFGEYVFSQVGMTGEEVLEVYRKSDVPDCRQNE